MATVQPSPLPEQSETPTRTSAPYGQACTNCAKAKCKCIIVAQPNPGSGRGSRPRCERCARLGRECRPSSSVRKRGAAGSKRAAGGATSAGVSGGLSAASRAANLEQKLEDLVAILKAQAGSTPGGAQASSQHDASEPHRQGRSDQSVRADVGVTASRRSNELGGRTAPGGPAVITPASTSYTACSTAGSTPSPLPAPAHDTLASAAEAEETLMFFRQHHLKSFPFIYLPPDMTAARLQRDRPYLWFNINAVCCKSPLKQAVYSQQTRAELAHRMLVACERSLDILLGALCLLGWTTHLCFRPTMSAVIGMVTALVADLRLDKPCHEEDPRVMNCFKSAHFVKTPHNSVARTMEERRATLAAYVMCSSGSSFLRCPSVRWTPHMEDSLNIMAANPEWEGDEILVLMVRIHRLADGVFQSQGSWAPEGDGYGTLKPPVNFYVKYFRRCLQSIKDQVPESLRDNQLAISIIKSAEMIISEIPFSNPFCGGRMSEWHIDTNMRHPATQPHSPRPMDIGRIEANFATLQTSKDFFEHFLTFDISYFVGFSFPVLINFFRAAQILYRLRIDEPGWDSSAVTSSIDLLGAMDVIADRFNRIPALYGFLTETDAEGNEVTNFYVKCSKTFSSTMPMWRAHFEQAEASRTRTATATAAATAAGAGVGADAAGSAGAGSQVSLATIATTGLNQTLGGRVNYPGMNNFMLPELFPMDFSMDDAWCNDIWSNWDASVLGPMQ